MGSTRRRGLSRTEVRVAVKRALERAGDRGLTKAELVATIGAERTSPQTVQRALVELRTSYDAPIECVGRDRRWRLTAQLPMPLEAPEHDDLLAVLVAQAVLHPLADAALRTRLARLVEDLDERARGRASASAPHRAPHRSTFSATLTFGTRTAADVLRTLSSACRRRVVRLTYTSPWKPVAEGRRVYLVEPWALRIHDGAMYLRAWSHAAAQPRTFRLAHVERVEVLPDAPRVAAPPQRDVWGDDNPALGIDHDRPGVAVVRFRGAIARWIAHIAWHPEETNTWIVPGELLERRVAYRSCREFARRLMPVLDGIEALAPDELRAEVDGLIRRYTERTAIAPEADLPSGALHRVVPEPAPVEPLRAARRAPVKRR